jgi:hypothetical protein
MGCSAMVIDTSKTAILVTDNIKDELKLKQAFAQIIATNTGEEIQTILNNPVFNSTKINDGIKRSYFEKVPNTFQAEENPYQYWFHMVMNQEFIDKVIQLAGFSLWPKDRHKIMFWPVKANQENQTVNSIEDEEMKYWIQRWAQALGLVIVFPDMQSTDIDPELIKNLSEDAPDYASQYYDVNHNLLLYIDENEETIKLRTGFFSPQQDLIIKHFQEDISSKVSIYYSLMADLATNYSNLYRLNPSEIYPHTQQVAIVNLSGYDDVLNLNNYFKNLSVIESYEILKATTTQLILRVQLKVTNEAFGNIINRGDILEVSETFSLHQITLKIKNKF